jgi:hypothetical protein
VAKGDVAKLVANIKIDIFSNIMISFGCKCLYNSLPKMFWGKTFNTYLHPLSKAHEVNGGIMAIHNYYS